MCRVEYLKRSGHAAGGNIAEGQIIMFRFGLNAEWLPPGTPTAVGVIGGIILLVLLVGLAIWLFQWLWNITMPEVFKLKQITYWQSFRLLIIAAFLFGVGHA